MTAVPPFRSPLGAALLAATLAAAGCTSIGPRTVTPDRFDYSSAIADSWKSQTLLNIVKTRYTDMPLFVDVASVVAGYSLQTGVTLGGVRTSGRALSSDTGSLSAQGIYTDRPTITYVPMTGEKFLRGLVTPIDPKNIFFLLQTGYPADFILSLTVESMNGLRNRSFGGGRLRPADPDFLRVLTLLNELQAANAFGMRVEEDKVKGSTAVVFFKREDLGPEVHDKSMEIRRLLRLSPDAQRFVLSYSPSRGGPEELAVNSRSMLQILTTFSSYVDVPAGDLAAGRAMPVPDVGDAKDNGRIRSSSSKPDDAYVAVRYRDRWFWIDDGDFQAKRALTAIMLFFTLADTGGGERLPLITIPAQ
jgi:hypothetical protein